jgi:hypothetical protein
MIISPHLPKIKSLLPARVRNSVAGWYLQAMMICILHHFGRMSAQQAASCIVGEKRHRANVGRFLDRHGDGLHRFNTRIARRWLNSKGHGQYVFIVDATNVSHQGANQENTISTGNRQRRACAGRRYSKYRRSPKSFHASVWGILLTPEGARLPFYQGVLTKTYCEKQGLVYRSQADLAAEMILALPLPPNAKVVVMGDTAFESKQLRAACAARHYTWIAPSNPERVLAGEKPRPKVWSLVQSFESSQFATVRLDPSVGKYVVMRRLSPARSKSKKYIRTFYVHEEKRTMHSVGDVRIVFSTKELNTKKGKLLRREQTKILLTNNLKMTTAEIVELYLLRWQIELFFKELKSELGMHQYRFRNWRRINAWMEVYCFTMMYLEWLREKRINDQRLTKKQREKWKHYRTHGLVQAVRTSLELGQIQKLQQSLRTPNGIRTLQRKLKQLPQKEYQCIA